VLQAVNIDQCSGLCLLCIAQLLLRQLLDQNRASAVWRFCTASGEFDPGFSNRKAALES